MIAKIKILALCAIYCLSQIRNVTSSDDVIPLENIDLLFEIGDREVDLHGQKNVILLIGGTGTGKSTLSKFLRQDPSLQIMQNEADDYVFTDGEEKIGNLDNHMSKTLFPQVDKDEQSGALLVDCAGFEDTRHPMYDLIASFFTQKVFNAASKMKIVVVESFERMRLSSDRTAFMRSIKQLAQLLQDEVATFNSSIGLVATKVDSSRPDGQLEKSVNVFLKATVKSLQKKKDDAEKRGEISEVLVLDRQIILVQFLAAGDKVAIFRRPDDLQSPWALPPLKKNFNQIRELIFKNLHFLDTNKQKFQVSVAPETVIYIQNDLFTASEGRLQQAMANIGNKLILDLKNDVEEEKSQFLKEYLIVTRNFILRYAAQMSTVTSTQSLLDYFGQNKINASLVQAVDLEMRKVEFLCTVVGSDVNSFRKQVDSMYGMWDKIKNSVKANRDFFLAATLLLEKCGSYEIYSNPPFTSSVTSENYADFITYILSLNLDSSIFLAASNVKPTPKQLHLMNQIKADKISQSIDVHNSDNKAKYSGNYILASQIQSPETINGELIIMAAQKFFIDRDLTLIDTHLTIMAPIVEVVGMNRILTLKGSSGSAFTAGAAPGANGQNGNPGFSSGDAKIYALDVVNANALTIRSIGGDGSDGQSGGNGVNGITSSPPVFTSFRGEEGDIFSDVSSSHYKVASWSTRSEGSRSTIFNQWKKVDRELIVSNEQGRRAPTNGADGGNGGAAAPPGDLKLALKNTASQIATESVIGKSGNGGLGGTAGLDAATCANALFHCHGRKMYKKILGFKLNNPSYVYQCSLVQKYNCESKFPAASNGKNGMRLSDLQSRSFKIPVTTLVEKEVQEYCEIAATSAALEKGGQVNEFLDFVFSLPGAESTLQNGFCVKKH